MEQASDLSKILGIIMENPELIESIKKLAMSEPDGEAEPATVAPATEKIAEDASDEPYIKDEEKESEAPISPSKRRKTLLCAIKPYVSKERARAIDSMLNIADVLEVMRRK